MRRGDRFELAIELAIPPDRRALLKDPALGACRYEVAIGTRADSGEVGLSHERLWLMPTTEIATAPSRTQLDLWPAPPDPPANLVHLATQRTPSGWRQVISKSEDSTNDYFKAETSGWNNPFRLGAGKSALANLPEDEERFPVATWVKRLLLDGPQRIVLSGDAMRRPSPPGQRRGYLPDGSNIPWVVHELETTSPDRLSAWTDHVRPLIPGLAGITTREREEDRHRYLLLQFDSGFEAPSWLVSDGTLRLLALTLLAYVPDLAGIYLIEEPENGIHPRAVELVLESLSSMYLAQVLCATHSPVVLSVARSSQVLCFARDSTGATDVIPGNLHPRLREWRGEVDLGTLFASGVLG